jgi:predicted pyridoxine 5'-phosphate oxidase superfamily flavin-nucleotide-binding protein
MTERHQLADAGFHVGELAVQQRAGVRPEAERLIRMMEAAELSGGIARFLAGRTFLVITGRGRSGLLWTSPLVGPPGFLEVRAEVELAVHAAIPAGDPLHKIAAGQKVGMTAVEFATRRRVRINGTLTAAASDVLTIEVEQAYGNCPQYIRPRLLEPSRDSGHDLTAARHAAALAEGDAQLIRSADTFFLGTVNPERGADASHRGGAAGFVRLDGTSRLWWPDYQGNNLFNSLGNLAIDPEAALLFFNFRDGHVLQLSGTADVEWDHAGEPRDDAGTGRRVVFNIQDLVSGRHLGAHEITHAPYPRSPALAD